MASLVPPDPDEHSTATGLRSPSITPDTYKRMVDLWSRQNWLRPGAKRTFDVQIPRAFARELFNTFSARYNIVIQPSPYAPTSRMFIWRDPDGSPDLAA